MPRSHLRHAMKRKYQDENVAETGSLRSSSDMLLLNRVPLEENGDESPPGLSRFDPFGRVKSPIPSSPPMNLRLWSLEPRRSKILDLLKQEQQDHLISCEEKKSHCCESPKPCTPGSYSNFLSPPNKSHLVTDQLYQSPYWSNPVSMNPFSPIPLEHLNGLCVHDDVATEIPASTIAPSTPPSGRRHNGDCLSTPPAPSERSFYPVAIPSFNNGTTKYPTSSAPSVIRNILGKTTFVSQSRFNSDFQCLSILGQGSSGIVYKVLSRLDGCLYAVKMSKVSIKGEAIRSSTLREVHALSSLSNRSDIGSLYIVRYHQAWIEDSRLFFQTELCETSLRDELQKHKQESASIQITENQAYKIFRDLSLALEFIHRQGVVHLDIKPENVFLKDEKYKLGDFGLASKAGGRAADEGDSRYLPLEMLSDDVTIDLTKVSSMRLPVTHYNTTHLIRPFSLV